jgi:hypothetical protein
VPHEVVDGAQAVDRIEQAEGEIDRLVEGEVAHVGLQPAHLHPLPGRLGAPEADHLLVPLEAAGLVAAAGEGAGVVARAAADIEDRARGAAAMGGEQLDQEVDLGPDVALEDDVVVGGVAVEDVDIGHGARGLQGRGRSAPILP